MTTKKMLGTMAAAGAACAALLGAQACASRRQPAAMPVRDTATLEGLIREELRAAKEPSAAIALCYGAEEPVAAAAGTTAAGGTRAAGTTSLYHVGSVSKAFASTLVATLVRDGLLDYGSALEDVLPGVPMRQEYRSATISDLMANRAGIIAFQRTDLEEPAVVEWLWSGVQAECPDDPRAQRAAAAAYVLSLPPLRGPDGKAEAVYSNAGWAVLGHAVEVAAGVPYEQALEERVLRPLGIANFKLGGWPRDDYADDEPVGHFPATKAGARPSPQNASHGYRFPDWLTPAGGLSLDARGFALFVRDQQLGLSGRGALLDAAGYRALHSVLETAKAGRFMQPQGADPSPIFLGMGWVLYPTGSGFLSVAEGTGGTYYAVALVYPEQDFACAGLVNSGSGLAVLERVFERATGMTLSL